MRRLVLVAASLGLAYLIDWALAVAQGFPPFILTAGVAAAWIVRAQRGSTAGLVLGSAVIIVIGLALQDLRGVFVALAALIAGVLLAVLVRRWRPRGRVRSPIDPLLMGMGTSVVTLLPAAVAELSGFGSFWIIWGATVTGTLAVLLPSMTLGSPTEGGRSVEFGIVAVAIVVTVLLYVMLSTQALVLGLAAWGLSPVLILLSARYGAGRGSFLVSVIIFAVPIARIVSDNLVPSPDALPRQGVAVFLLLTTNAAALLLRRDRSISIELNRNRKAISAFLNHSDPVWFVKVLTPTGELRYEWLGGGAFRHREDGTEIDDAELFGGVAAIDIERLDQAVISTRVERADIETLVLPDGQEGTFITNRFPLFGESGKIIGVGGVRTDITTQQDHAQTVSEQAQLLGAMFESGPLPTLVIELDDQARVVLANRAASNFFELPVEVLTSMLMSELMEPEEWQQLEVPSREIVTQNPTSPRRFRIEVALSRDGFDDRSVVATVGRLDLAGVSTPDQIILHLEDATAQRRAEEAVHRTSTVDRTTGLYNRQALVDLLDAGLHRMGVSRGGEAHENGLALVVCDLDDFQKLNDSYGYAVGDQVLSQTASRIGEIVPEESVLARIGADEFAIVIPNFSEAETAILIGRLQQALSRNLVEIDNNASPLVSFGAVIVTETGLSSAEVLRRGELALYQAKSGGRGRVDFYADAMRERAQKILNVREELARAIAGDGFSVAYQPIVNLNDGRVMAYEALVRLVAQDGELLSPGDFLPIARTADLVTVIDQMVLARALADLKSNRLAQSSAGLHLNCEPEDLRDPNYAMNVLSRVHATALDPHRLTIEITEGALLQVDAAVRENVAALREAGIQIAIDDFGSGYSSLSQLRELNPDKLKIDRSFIADLDAKNPRTSIIASVIDLAHQLDIKVTAEGIETREQAEALRRMGCDLGQGFLFGRPERLPETTQGLPSQLTDGPLGRTPDGERS